MPKRKSGGEQQTLFEAAGPAVVKRDTLKGRVVRRKLTSSICSDALGKITKGCEIYCLTMGKFSLIDVIEHVLDATGPADVVVSTWTAANADIGFARRLFDDGRITSLRFLVDYSFLVRQPAYAAGLRQAFGDDAIRVTKNHAKFVTVRNKTWNVALRTSMNLNECRRLENVEISEDARLCEFLAEVVETIFSAQSGTETFERSAGEHEQAFGVEFGEDGQAAVTTGDPRYFGDGAAAVDLRRVGATRRG